MRAPTRLTVKAGLDELLDALHVCVAALTAPDMDAKDISRIRATADRYEDRLRLANVRRENLLRTQKVQP